MGKQAGSTCRRGELGCRCCQHWINVGRGRRGNRIYMSVALWEANWDMLRMERRKSRRRRRKHQALIWLLPFVASDVKRKSVSRFFFLANYPSSFQDHVQTRPDTKYFPLSSMFNTELLCIKVQEQTFCKCLLKGRSFPSNSESNFEIEMSVQMPKKVT